MNRQNKEFILKNINTILAVVSVVLMLLPMLTINAFEAGYSNRLSISGFGMAAGMSLTNGEDLNRNFFAWLMVVVPVFSVLTNYIKRLFPLKKIALFAAPLVCVAFELNAEHGFSWKGYCDTTVDELLSGTGSVQTKTMQMEAVLREKLTDLVPADEIYKRAEELGISERTVKIAKRNLNVLSEKQGDKWYWKLPNQECKGVTS